jgi:hypothetical protein
MDASRRASLVQVRRVGACLLHSLRRTREDERGISLVLVAAGMVALVGMAALTIDVGIILQERRSVQNAADAAALAGARYLPGSPGVARDTAFDYLVANGYSPGAPDVEVKIETGYEGDPRAIAVSVTKDKPLAFARVLGEFVGHPGAIGVAKVVTSFDDNYAIFAIGNNCPSASEGASISGTFAGIGGAVHSNGEMSLAGSNHSVSPGITYTCSYQQGGSGHTIEEGTKNVGERPSPVDWVYEDFVPCTYTFPNPNVNLKATNAVWANPQKTNLRPGIYCFGGNVTVIGDGINGTVTFAARGKINWSGVDADLDPFFERVVFYAESGAPNAISVQGDNNQFDGLLYAPFGGIEFQGSDWVLHGSLVGQTVDVDGAGATVTADGSGNTENVNPVVSLIR